MPRHHADRRLTAECTRPEPRSPVTVFMVTRQARILRLIVPALPFLARVPLRLWRSLSRGESVNGRHQARSSAAVWRVSRDTIPRLFVESTLPAAVAEREIAQGRRESSVA